MSLPKNPRFDLKRKRSRVLETGMILSLAFLIVAFKFFPEIEKAEQIEKDDPDIFISEKIDPTTQPPDIPPPPEPKIVVESPDDEFIDDVPLEDTGLDITVDVPDTPPPFDNNKGEDADDRPPYKWVETMPEPIGGIAGIQKRIAYPDFAVRVGLEGRVILRAYVDTRGNVYKVDVIKSLGGGCDEAAVKAVMETKFTPGKQRGKPVKVMVAIPISFDLR
ncbi:MAG: energy transducer TonB [Ignavibacteriae bacterium]|nr:energy transducer TonB [Ignavibacteriota bacterium]NOG96397.1 energy transducer TonB [Ignavibacteriota bacterium]